MRKCDHYSATTLSIIYKNIESLYHTHEINVNTINQLYFFKANVFKKQMFAIKINGNDSCS